MKSKIISVVVVAGYAFGLASTANAALISCPAAFTADGSAKVYWNDPGTVTAIDAAATACQYISPADNNNVASLANVNAAAFFGTSSWLSNGQTQIETSDWTGQSGDWSIANVDFVNYDYIIVFKDGVGTNLTAFLFNEESASGQWNTPFTDPPFDLPGNSQSADNSHASIFKRTPSQVLPPAEEPNPTPEPGMLFLMGAGLLGLGMARRRKSV